MSASVPLTVRVKSAYKDSDITNQVQGLQFGSSAPGGYRNLSVQLNRPLTLSPQDIRNFAKVYVYDGRSGAVVWEGELEDPGRGVSDQGEVWSVSAVGGMAHTKDETFPIIYIDKGLDNWVRSRYSLSAKAKTELGEVPDTSSSDPEGVTALYMYTEAGTAITTVFRADMIYRHPWNIGQKIARVRANYLCGENSNDLRAQVVMRNAGETADFIVSRPFVTTPGVIAADIGNGMPTTENVASFRFTYTGSGILTATANAYVYFYDVSVRCTVFNKDGTENFTNNYLDNNINPDEVVADLLGRKLSGVYDGANAYLVGSGVQINQLAYLDGTTASDILDDILTYDPGFYWAVWESNVNNGKYRFEYRPWPTSVRYEADAIDGFDSPGSVADLYNSVDVRWRNEANKIRHTVVTSYVRELADTGLTRQFYIDISNELGDAQNALYTAQNFLAEHQYPPNAGTLTVSRPILDNYTGRVIQPWEIVPGNLIRVRGVNPRVDSLNPTNRDGVTIFRVVSMEYNSETSSATLELDSHSRTVARALATLATKRLRKL